RSFQQGPDWRHSDHRARAASRRPGGGDDSALRHVPASNFMVTGAAEFPKATEPSMHTEILMKSRFFPILDATVTVFGVTGKSWTQPNIWVNRDLMPAESLG